ncbi:response regulator [Roseomonas genomospecies 6]|uniref:Response regulator n=1 Tax=Roseomonas genomospecies 6 TaxID=214106 RepID=A0A9W7TWK8_9PROT|nr:response regulator [Roseomonas genomospecies 6]KAA0679501.1 response regulator [Roseomonas genomospecies 6]
MPDTHSVLPWVRLAGCTMRILIVEDNALVAFDLEQQLLHAGHDVVGIAATASDAEAIAAAEGADVALMDVALADGSSGVDAAASLKRVHNIPSVFITATLPDTPEVRATGLGVLAKPFSEREVAGTLLAIEALLEGRFPSDAPARLVLFGS